MYVCRYVCMYACVFTSYHILCPPAGRDRDHRSQRVLILWYWYPYPTPTTTTKISRHATPVPLHSLECFFWLQEVVIFQLSHLPTSCWIKLASIKASI